MGSGDESQYARELNGGVPRLRFEQPLEREFRAHYLTQNVPRLRVTLLVVLFSVVMLSVLDWRLLPGDVQVPLLVARLGIVLPVLLAALLATYPGVLARYIHWVVPTLAGILAFSAVLTAWLTSAVNPASGLAGVLMTLGVIFLMLSLRISVALMAALPILCGYLLFGLGFELPIQRLGYEFLGLTIVTAIFAYGCYRLEHASRTSFLEREIVNILTGSDALTGIPNRRMFNTHVQRVWRQAMRESRGLAVAIIEVDHFDTYSERYDQPAAESMLRRVAHGIMGGARRPLDFGARFAAEEFAIVLYDPDASYVEELAGRIRDRVAMLDIPHEASPTSERVSVSIGVAMSQAGQKEDLRTVMELADSALSDVKEQGRNGVVVKDLTSNGARVLMGPWKSA